MNVLLNKLLSLLAPRRREYLTTDKQFNIVETSLGLQRFVDHPDEIVKGTDIRVGFPELIGLEEILSAIIEGQQDSFELNAIARFFKNGSFLYFDLYFITNPDPKTLKGDLIFFLEDVTEKMILEQTLVQAANEKSLLLEALAVAKDYVDKIITSMADALLITTASGTIKTINQAAQDLVGYQADELIGQPISMVIKDEEFLRHNSLSKGQYSPLERPQVVCETKLGKKLYITFSCSAIQTDVEGVKDFAYVGRDVTEQKRVQQRQRVQYAISRILSESTTLNEIPRKILEAIGKTLGWDLGELWIPGQNLETQPNDNKTNFKSALLRCVKLWVQPGVDLQVFTTVAQQISFPSGVGLPGQVWATNSPKWITDVVDDDSFVRRDYAVQAGLRGAFGFPIQGDSETLGVIIFFSRQIQTLDEDLLETMVAIGNQLGQFIKRKQAEKALKESEERYRDLFENASDLIQSCDPNGRLLYVNQAWLKTLGYSKIEIQQLNLLDIIHPDGKSQFIELFYRVIAGEEIEQIQASFISKEGQKISVEGNINCKFVEGNPVATRAIFRDITKRLETEAALRYQQKQTERLLLNILPEPIADRLKQELRTIAEDFTEVSVMFADIVGFTQMASSLSAIQLVDLLNEIFSAFDRLSEKHKLEKIKTIGDAYMVVGGLPKRRADHAEAIAEMALDMQATISQFRQHTGKEFNIRIGINSGPVVAGVIGLKKFSYDLWGDTVNIASRMESHGLAGQIQVSNDTYKLLSEQYSLKRRGVIDVKGKGKMTTYFLIGRKG